jgi:hypothetical protein
VPNLAAHAERTSLHTPRLTRFVVWMIVHHGAQGTSYTITTVEAATGTTTATNYAEGFDVCVGVASQDAPPCLHKERLPRPATSILTKTHW